MSPIEVWGPAVWTLFHTLAERVSEQAYPIIANHLFSQIVKICKVLPCPDCATDASNFLAKINISTLKTKTDFKNMIYLFHNYVNVKKRKPLFNYKNMNVYKNYPLIPVLNNFNAKFNTKGNMNLISESFQRNLVQSEFKRWIVANIGAFVPPPQIQVVHVVEEVKEEVPIVEEKEVPIVEEEVVPLVEEEVPIVEEEVVPLVEEEVPVVEVVPIVEEKEVPIVEEEVVPLVEEEVPVVEVVPLVEEEVVPLVEEEVPVVEEVKEEVPVVEEVVIEEFGFQKTKKYKKSKK